MRRLFIVAALAVISGVVGLLSFGGSTTASTTVVVKPSNLDGWAFVQEGATGAGAFVTGPPSQPAGTGSARLVVDSTGREILGKLWPGTRLDEISDLEYSTWQPTGTGPAFATSFQFNVDYDLTDGNTSFQGRLVFEPYLNGTITHGTWQSWTPLSGVWWASGAPGNTICPNATPCRGATLLSNWPAMGLHGTAGRGAILFRAGGPWAGGFSGNVDAFTITTTATDTFYDFEPETPCTTVCYVDDATGNDTFGGDTPASAKKTIQAAVNQVTPGGTVHVAAGTYEENVIVNKSVTISGAGASTIVQPALSFPGPGCGSSLCVGHSSVFLTSADDITIEELTVDGDNPSLTSGVVVGGADLDARNGIIEDFNAGVFDNLEVSDVTVQNIYLRGIYASSGGDGFHIHDNTLDNIAGEAASIAIFNFEGSGVIEDNQVSNANDAIASNWSRGTQYLNNTVTDSGSGVHSDNNGGAGGTGDLLQGNDVSDCTSGGYGVWTFAPFVALVVDQNTVTNCSVGLAASGENDPAGATTFTDNVVDGAGLAGSVGVYVTTDRFGFGSTDVRASFTGNVIQNNDDGFNVEAQPGFTADVDAHLNEISGNAVTGATATGTGTFDADLTANWWGNDTGPAHAGNTGGTANAVTDNIYYSPWLGFGDASGTNGFQAASPMTWIANPNGCKVTCIQRAVDFSEDGDTIKGKTGVFNEQVTIDKDVTVTQASTPVIDGGGAAFAVKITADGATLNGYEVRNAVDGVVIDSGADNVTVTANDIHTFTSAGLRATSSTGDDISNNTITGPHTPSCVGGFWGMRLTDTSGDIDLNTISGIGNGTVSGGGCQEGRAIEATGAGTLQITNNDISEYQKSGIIVRNTVNTTISGNTTAGDGPTAFIAMNGITITSTGTHSISGNHTSGHRYTPESDISCGILLFFATASVSGNDSTSDEVGICALGGNGTSIAQNDVIGHTQQGILVDGAANVLVDDNDIDGQGSGTTATIGTDPDTDTRYYGVFVVGSTGTISNNDITGITHGPSNGTQSGVAIRVSARPGETSNVDITGNTLTDYQKNGMVITNVYGGAAVHADIVGNTVTGAGPVNYIAQNGIQISGNATGTVTGNNDVSGHDYTPFTAAAVGVLIFDAGLVNVTGNQIHDNMEGLYIQDTDGVDANGNVFTANYDTSIVVFNSSNGGYHFNTFNGQPGSYGMYLADAAHDNDIQGNDFLGNEYGVVLDYSGAGEPLGTDISSNDFIGNTTFGVEQTGTLVGPVVDAEDNWWNACDGPSGAGPGSGDAVSTNVDFDPFEHGACDTDNDLLTDDSEDLIYFTDYLDADTDGDGCADGEEILFPVTLGGGRDPLFVWDFYDVNGSQKIDALDIGLVRMHFNPGGPVPPAEMIYDRSHGASPHAPGAPDNRINAIDISLVRIAFNDNCQAPPP
jgi:nitrous oxidase accessory protein NosD